MNEFEKVANEVDRELLTNNMSQEFAFEFVKGSKTCTATIPKGKNKFRKKLESMVAEGVEGVSLRYDGADCQVYTFPVKYLRISKPKKTREYTEEEKEALRKRLAEARAKGKNAELSEEEEELLDEMDEEDETADGENESSDVGGGEEEKE